MPKAKPTQVITHRIELGEWERQNIGKPVSDTAQAASVVTSLGIAGVGVAAIGATYAIWELWDVFSFAKQKLDLVTEPLYEGGPSTSDFTLGPLRTIGQLRRIFSL